MKDLKSYLTERAIEEAKSTPWSKDKEINDIFQSVFGNRADWIEGGSRGHSKDLKGMVITFTEWYTAGDNLTWWTNDSDFGNDVVKVYNDDYASALYDIKYGICKYEGSVYRDPCTVYVTPSFWGVIFYEQIFVCGKDGKKLKDLSDEIYDAKQKELEQQKKELEERTKRDDELFNAMWDDHVNSNDKDNADMPYSYLQLLQPYKGKVVKVKLAWEGYESDEVTFIATLTSLYGRMPQFDLPVTENFKAIPPVDYSTFWDPENYHEGPDTYTKQSSTYGSIHTLSEDIIIKNIKEVSKEDKEKYLKVVKKELDKHDNGHTWYTVVYNHIS